RPATAGRPNSRATIAPCDNTPPVSITKPQAFTNNGTQAGSVLGQTKIYGSLTSEAVVGSVRTRADPSATPADRGTPWRTSALSVVGASIPSSLNWGEIEIDVGSCCRPIASRSSLKST